ncbi:MAG: FKBP-type peptidyl-prolyl cis-trans isomerase [Gemmatimonadota bacterium]|nr:FKBP-type peptidyl-prolyl cis-trans isomerase [Gemmatimonadota bacterium]
MDTMEPKRRPLSWSLVLLAPVLAAAGCFYDGPTDVEEVEFEVIEEVTFDSSLGIDLARMIRLPTGIYIEDLSVGEGPGVEFGDLVEIVYTGYLRDGVEYLPEDTIDFQIGGEVVPEGVHLAMIGQQAGGERLMVIPPEHGYGARGYQNVPAGSILIFEVELVGINQ